MKQIVIDENTTTYLISEDGRCYNSKTKNWLKGQVSNSGYLSYNLTLNTCKKRIYAHRLVALHYLDNPSNKKEVNHLNGDKLNNHFTNLEWCTPKENQSHALLTGLRTTRPVYQFDKNGELVKKFLCASEAVKLGIISISVLRQQLLCKQKTLSKGYYWSYSVKFTPAPSRPNTGLPKAVLQYNLKQELLNTYASANEAARINGYQRSRIGECCTGKRNTYKNCFWKYKEDIV